MTSARLPIEPSRPRSLNAAARRRRDWLQRMLPASVLLAGLLGAPALLFSAGGLSRLDDLSEERRRVELEISRARKRIVHLRAEAQAIKSDPRAVERVARDQLGLVRPTEVVLLFEEAPVASEP